MAASKKKSKLFKYFENKFVSIYIKGSYRNKLVFMGYLVDEDAENFYLSQNEDNVFAAIPKEQNGGIVMGDELNFLMEQIAVPNGEVQ